VLGAATGPLDTCARAGEMASMNEIPEICNPFDSIDKPILSCRDFRVAIPKPRHFIRKHGHVKRFCLIVPKNEQAAFSI
jgi:hypothetical protein